MRKSKNLLALIGTLILLVSLTVPMMQCAPAAEEEVTPPPEEGGIKYGGRFNVAFAPGQTMDDLRCDSDWQYTEMGCNFWPMVYDGLWLLGPGPDYEAVPRLASSWETEDGKTWIFHLRENATFHDGVPVTAEDVAFTMEYLPTADPAWATATALCEPGSIKVIDDYTVQFTLEIGRGGPYPPVWVPMLPKHIWEPYKDNMLSFPNDACVGSGPFKLKEFKSEEYIWFEANKDYWGERPYVDEVVWGTYGSLDALYMAFKNGEADMLGYSGLPALGMEELRGVEGVEVLTTPDIVLNWLSFNLYKDGPIQDLNVRKAIMHGIDRDKIIDMVFLGYAEKIDSFICTEFAEHNPNLPQYDYDPDLANEILDGGGYIDTDGDGIRNDPATEQNLAFELLVSSAYTDQVKIATLINEELKDVGIDVITKVLDHSTYLSFMHAPVEEEFDFGFQSQGPGPDGDWIWEFARSWEAGGAGWNTSYYSNPRMDELLDKMLAEKDLTKRKEFLYEMQMMITEDLPYGFLYRADVIDPVSTKFEGYVQMIGGISTWINPWSHYKVHLK